MLVVLSREKKRSSSGTLREKFQHYHLKCLDTNNSDYCMKGIPRFRIFGTEAAVEVILNEFAEKTMKGNPSDLELETHVGRTSRSLLPEELQNIDLI